MKLVIAEKPSVGVSIAAVLGAKKRQEGYMEGNGYLVSWCIGHLCDFVNADVYDAKYSKWRYDDLPIIPNPWSYQTDEKKVKQYTVLKTLLDRKDVEEVINACDAGRERELRLRGACSNRDSDLSQKECAVHKLNDRALRLLDRLICFKESILKEVLNCQMFTMNYPLLIEHIIREAKLYRKYLHMLERDGDLNCRSMREIECFWNRIMMEHALFIRGLLDPAEAELIASADESAKEFAELLRQCSSAQDQTLTASSLEKTVKLRDFKAAGAKGIQECKIRSVILPLLADHVLREANHYIRLLKG